jgi:hypothetical protein
MSYQSPNISKIAKATPLPDSPAEDKSPTEDGNNNNNNNNNNSPKPTLSYPDFDQSNQRVYQMTNLCLRFKTMAETLRESSELNQREAGDHPSQESRESARGLKRHWYQDLLEDEGATACDVVLKPYFFQDAKDERQRLKGFGQTEAIAGLKLAWKNVVELVEQCVAIKADVDRAMGQFK